MGVGSSVPSLHVKKVEEVDKTYHCAVEHGPADVSRNIDVLFVCDEWGSSKGGLSTFNREFAVNFAKSSSNNINVHCYVCDSNENEKQHAITNGVKLITAKRPPGVSDPVEGLKIPPDELRYPDVVVGHGRKFGIPAHFITDRAKCKWVQFVHVYCEAHGKFKQDGPNSDAIAENDKKNKQELELCKRADLTVAVGKGLQKKFARRIKGIEVITPGIFENFDKHPREASEDGTGQEFGVFMFGRGKFEDFLLKGYDIVGKAIASLERKFKLTFVGSPEDEHRKIEKWFRDETKIARNQLTIRGYCSYEEMKEMFSEADVVVMPSRMDGFGLVALEGISAGVPVLISIECGIAKALEEVEGGLSVVVDSESPEEWAKKIRELSEQSPGTRETNAMRLRVNYGKQYDWKRECKKFEGMILDLMKEPQKSQAINFLVSDSSGNMTRVEAVISQEGNGSSSKDAFGRTVFAIHSVSSTRRRNKVSMSFTDPGTSDKKEGKMNESIDGVESTGDTSVNQDMEASVDQLCSSARKGDVTEIESLPSHGLCIDSRGNLDQTPPVNAAKYGKVEAVECLISKGADPDSRDKIEQNSLHWASSGGHVDVIKSLVNHMTDIEPRNALGLTPLMVAADEGNVNAVQHLISEGADPASRDKHGHNSLHYASYSGHVDVIELLVNHMPDIESRNTSGVTPLMMAVVKGDVKAVQCLISNGADPASQDRHGQTSLHWATSGSHVNVIELLVNCMTDIEPRNALGATPLMVAAGGGNVKAVECLISKGADPASRDKRGQNSLQYASNGGHVDVAELLVNRMANIEPRDT